jgi:2-amino-4-hydroxy-6-hydroxymethyldihydropteridine diphosphokinase
LNILSDTYLSLGSNKGDKIAFLQKAVDLIAEQVGIVSQISPVYKTQSWGFESEDFFNIVIKLKTKNSPESLLTQLIHIERIMGRERVVNKTYQSRNIDIDILLFEDEIIFSSTLVVPHPLMNKRRFVLQPLADIVPNLIHPIEKKSIKHLLLDCTDSSTINLTDLQINRPNSISELYNYIAIEGNIGAGKTSLTNLLSDDFNAKMVLERYADNPFLPKFYENEERYAFPLEMSFLADRYHQLTDDLAQFDLFKSFIISDYYIFKSLIFAQITLPPEEFSLYRKMFDIMYKEITKPDLYIYLYQNTTRLLENIKKRGREYEQNISAEYLQKIHNGYANFTQTEKNLNVLIIDVSEMDFVNNPEDYHKIVKEIMNYKILKNNF